MKGDGLHKKIRVKEVKEEAKDFKTFTFEDDPVIEYKAGQYLTLSHFNGKEETRRSYSIISSPLLKEPLSIGVKRIENGFFSRQLVDNIKPGDELTTTGSGGFFVLPDNIDDYTTLLFFAAGSGITPILSLIKTALHQHIHLKLVLIYSNHSVENAAFLSPLKELEEIFEGRFELELLFSNDADLSHARLHRELLFSFVRQYAPSFQRTMFYICGPESYMRLCTYTLQEMGVHSEALKKETFITQIQAKRDLLPPDANDHFVSISVGSKKYELQVHYPDSILKAAKKIGIDLPYSCEAGRCGNCVAKCIKGQVWHSYNEVLTEKDLQNGLVLTCVGHPVNGNVELEF